MRKSKEKSPALDFHEKIIRSIKKLGLTEEAMRKLEEGIKPIQGAPFGQAPPVVQAAVGRSVGRHRAVGAAPVALGWPHYRALLDVREDAERFWYQEKAQNHALSLRALEQAVRENLFYKILGRKPPEPPKLGPKRPAPDIKDKEFDNNPSYQKLVKDIKKVIDRAEAKGVAIRHRREDILNCSPCGAFEDVLCGEENRRTFLSSGEETAKPFLVIDTKATTDYRERGCRYTTEYQYVCGVCGIHQSASFTCIFYETECE